MTARGAAAGSRAAAALSLAAVLLAACAPSAAPPTAPPPAPSPVSASSASSAASASGARPLAGAERPGRTDSAERSGPAAGPSVPPHVRWGLAAPLAPAPRPTAPPRLPDGGPAADGGSGPGGPTGDAGTGTGPLPVVRRVPTTEKVVFLTYDDGAQRDPRFAELVRDLRLPVTVFLSDRVLGPGYGRLAALRGKAVTVQNHTLDQRGLRGLPYAGQRAEICRQQEKLRERLGAHPHLLHPPYGAYDTTTLRAARDCGLSAVVLGRVTVNDAPDAPDAEDAKGPKGPKRAGEGRESPRALPGAVYADGEQRLLPGDVVHVPGYGTQGLTVTDRTLRALALIRESGLVVGHLEDWLPGPGSG